MNLDTYLGCIPLHNRLCNASGPLTKNYHDLKNIDLSESACIISKTCTLTPRQGNPTPKCIVVGFHSLNSHGLENHGIEYYSNLRFHKPFIVSVLGDPETLKQMLNILGSKPEVSGVEINLSCPNINPNKSIHLQEI